MTWVFRKDLLENGNIIPFEDLTVLDKLEGKKVIVTNCGQECAEEILDFFKIKNKFDLIIGKTPERLKQLKPNPEMILEAIRKLDEISKKYDVKIQEAVRESGGTNASKIHLENLGIPTVVLGVPVRYTHSHYNFIAYSDYIEICKLVKGMLVELNEDVINNF